MPLSGALRLALTTRLGMVILLTGLFSFGAPSSRAADEEGPIFGASGVEKLPEVLSQVPPVYPMALRAKRIETTVLIDFLVLPNGIVKSAHAPANIEPEFAAAAVAAVSQWTFKPGTVGGRPVTTRMRVPIVFALNPSPPGAINLAVGPLKMTANIRTRQRGVIIHFTPTGPSAATVHAGRIFLTQAEDDTGAALTNGGEAAFHHASVGGADASTTREPITLTLMGLANDAKAIRRLEGKLELFVPSLDPAATVTIGDVPSRFGVPLENPSLKHAGVTLVVYDKPTAHKLSEAKDPNGPQEFDGGTFFGSDTSDPSVPPALAQAMRDAQKANYAKAGPEFAERMSKMNEMCEHDIAVAWHDPTHRIVGVEFQTADGASLAYDHKGHYHSELPAKHTGLDSYDLRAPLPPGARIVCWVTTENSILTMPISLAGLPLPEPPPSAKPAEPATTSP